MFQECHHVLFSPLGGVVFDGRGASRGFVGLLRGDNVLRFRCGLDCGRCDRRLIMTSGGGPSRSRRGLLEC